MLTRAARAGGAARHGAQTRSAAISATPNVPATAHGSARRHAGTTASAASGGASATSPSAAANRLHPARAARRRSRSAGASDPSRGSAAAAGAPAPGRSAGSACQFTSSFSTVASVLRDVVAVERAPPRQHLVEHDAERPDVGAAIDGAAARLLGRHVGGRAEDHAQSAWRGAVSVGEFIDVCRSPRPTPSGSERLGEAEVEHLHRAVGAAP